MTKLEPQTGTAFKLRAGQSLRVIDLDVVHFAGGLVAGLVFKFLNPDDK